MRSAAPVVRVLAALAALASSTAPAAAQLETLAPGVRIRVSAPSLLAGRPDASVVGHAPDTIILVTASRVVARVPLGAIAAAEVSRGKSAGLGAAQGALWGGALGASVGLSMSGFADDIPTSRLEAAAQGAAVYAAIGALIGGMSGVERWSPLALPVGTPTSARIGHSPELALGARIRTDVGDRRVVGTIVARGDDSILVASPSGATVLRASTLESVDVSRGKSRGRGARRGALWGAGVFTVLGVVSLAADGAGDRPSLESDDAAGLIYILAVSGAAWGAAIGALVGSERWERLGPAPPRTAWATHRRPAITPVVAPAMGRLRLGLRARW